jgi:hypothetical protein
MPFQHFMPTFLCKDFQQIVFYKQKRRMAKCRFLLGIRQTVSKSVLCSALVAHHQDGYKMARYGTFKL